MKAVNMAPMLCLVHKCHDFQNDTQHSYSQHNDPQHNDPRHNYNQNNDNQHSYNQHTSVSILSVILSVKACTYKVDQYSILLSIVSTFFKQKDKEILPAHYTWK